MPSVNDAIVWPEDVRATASVCRRVLEPVTDADWDGPAGELEWSCRTTLAHVLSALLYYAIISPLARPSSASRAKRIRPFRSPSCSTRLREGPASLPKSAPPHRRGPAGRTTGGDPTRPGSPPSRATRCSCTRATWRPGSGPASTRLARCARACSRVCFPGHRAMDTLGRSFAGPMGAWRWVSGPASPQVGCPIPPHSVSGMAGTPTWLCSQAPSTWKRCGDHRSPSLPHLSGQRRRNTVRTRTPQDRLSGSMLGAGFE